MHLDQLIVELKKIEFPETIEIGKHFTITNVSRMIESHYSILKANGSNPKKKLFKPYYDRLLMLHEKFSLKN